MALAEPMFLVLSHFLIILKATLTNTKMSQQHLLLRHLLVQLLSRLISEANAYQVILENLLAWLRFFAFFHCYQAWRSLDEIRQDDLNKSAIQRSVI